MKYIIIFLSLTGLALAQYAAPSDYTDVLGLRLYDQGDNPGADSLNANWTDIDNWAASVAEEDSSNTFTGIQTFNGATFAAGSHGVTTFADSAIFTSRTELSSTYPYNATSFMGSTADPFLRMYAKNFWVVNSAGDDSVAISYNETDDAVNIDNLTIGTQVNMDSAVGFQNINFISHQIDIDDVGDSVISVGQKMTSIWLNLPGDMQESLEELSISGFSVGDFVIIYNGDATDTCTFEDITGGDGDCNMQLAGDFNMNSQYDSIALLCVSVADGVTNWIELWRKDL